MRYLILCFGLFITNSLLSQPILKLVEFYRGFDQSIAMAMPDSDSALFYVVERPGRIVKITKDGQYMGQFLNITDLVSTQGEGGLLGLTFHPDYVNNATFYLHYTRIHNGQFQSVIAQIQAHADRSTANRESLTEIYTIDQPYDNHNGGDIHFGPDGKLYIATGDGGSGGDPDNYAQNYLSPLGKILRFDTHPLSEEGQYLSIPEDNPFSMTDHALSEIWALGLRNPWRFSFDRETQDIWVADVGQEKFEEIHRQRIDTGGLNYGWKCKEGFSNYSTCDHDDFLAPVYVYGHPNQPECSDVNFCGQSISGGYVYRGSVYPDLYGYYVFADFVSPTIWTYDLNTGTVDYHPDQPNFRNIVGFFEDHHGEMYAISLNGVIYKVTTDTKTGLNPKSNSNPLKVYPNPTQNYLTLEVEGYDHLLIYDNQGKVVKNLPESKVQHPSIYVGDLVPGLYHMIMRQQQRSLVVKFTIQ